MYFRWGGPGQQKKAGLFFPQAIYSATVEDNLFITSVATIKAPFH